MTTVSLSTDHSGCTLLRNGRPYFVKGAVAYPQKMELISAYGGNSIRTHPETRALLDRAHAAGLSVLCHLPLRPQRDGMDYDDPVAVARQYDRILDFVRAYKDHPAVLIWELGNELEFIAHLVDCNSKTWDAVNHLAEAIHNEDSRPVLTVVGGIEWNLSVLVDRCPALDLLGINAYGNILAARGWLDSHGWSKPYLVTEWGPTGWWQVPHTDFGVPIEENSSEKADQYRLRYEQAILGDPRRCLGSYVFLWKQHQEHTHTWFGMFDAAWRESEAVDVMRYEWTGRWPDHRAPRVGPALIDGQPAAASIQLAAGSQHQASIHVESEDELSYHWEILPENTAFGYGGQGETKPASAGQVLDPAGQRVRFAAPGEKGAYRLFATVYDRHNHFAYANIPFLVI